LYVDDNDTNLIAIEAALAPLGRKLVLARLLEQDFALLILDVAMPGMDGFETVRLVRSRAHNRATAIIFITGLSWQDDAILKGYELGAFDFMTKPVRPEVLRAKAAVFMQLQERTLELHQKAEELRAAQARAHERELTMQRKRFEAEVLERQMQQMAEADKRKDEFLAILAHELRNPLQPLQTAVEVMEHEPDKPVPERVRGVIRRQVHFIGRLVDDLLDVARFQTGEARAAPRAAVARQGRRGGGLRHADARAGAPAHARDRPRQGADGQRRSGAARPGDHELAVERDRHDRLRPGSRSPECTQSGLRRPHRQTRERREDHARAVRHHPERGKRSMNTFESPKNGNGNGKAKNGSNGHAAKAGPDQLHQRELLAALRQFKRGNFEVKLREDMTGIDGQIAETFNELVAMVKTIRDEAQDVSTAVGKEGQAQKRMRRFDTTGGWNDYIAAVNEVIEDLSGHANEIARVVTAVARGDLEQTMDVEDGGHGPRRGEFLRHAKIVNGMVVRLAQFGSEVTRVALEVGGEGKLGAHARVQGVSGVWKDLTDSVNLMASNLTSQVREIARVTTAVAQGDLTKTITIDVKGEILELKNTMNTMVDQRNAFASEVTRVAREVGTEGVLGGQAQVRRERGDARRARGRSRGCPRWPGRGARRVRYVARADRQRQRHGA
jgi:DNA-binding response OmpR family regulator/HAMP domain-containing protein